MVSNDEFTLNIFKIIQKLLSTFIFHGSEIVMNYAKQGYKKLRNFLDSNYLPSMFERAQFDYADKLQVHKFSCS